MSAPQDDSRRTPSHDDAEPTLPLDAALRGNAALSEDDDGATLADVSVPAEIPEAADDQTLADVSERFAEETGFAIESSIDSSATGSTGSTGSNADADSTADADGATLADAGSTAEADGATLADAVSTAEADSIAKADADGATLADAGAGDSAPVAETDERTIAQETVNGFPDNDAFESPTDDRTVELAHGEPPVEPNDATIQQESFEQPAEEFATMQDGTVNDDGAERSEPPDQTIVESDTTGSRGRSTASRDNDLSHEETFVETGVSASRPERRDDATHQIESAGAAGRKKKNRKAAHETAERWEDQQRYQLVNNFARGGLGQIWLAQDARLRREVAYKELLPNALSNRNALERFLEEAQITGQLEHPGIVPIYDIGYQENGTPFYAMKLVRGDTMEKAIGAFHELPRKTTEWELAFRKLLRNVIDVCNAMAFAHDRGVLHRDLKPLNVMIGAFGETLVLDWGLAKVLDVELADPDGTRITTSKSDLEPDGATVIEDGTAATGMTGATSSTAVVSSVAGTRQITGTLGATAGAASVGASQGATAAGRSVGGGSVGLTRKMIVTDVRTAGSQTMAGSIMGTPAYMPPEQARGDLEKLDARSDIYSLGGILYKLLTNHQPIARGKLPEVMKKVKTGDIIKPRDHIADVPRPLEAIAMKAMATRQEDRYRSALQIASDVEAWLADEPVSCFDDPPLIKARRWAKKHRTVVGSVVSVALVLVAVSFVSATVRRNALNQIRDFAQAQITLSEQSVDRRDFGGASDALTTALGRVGDDSDLSDLKAALDSRLELIETRRLTLLRNDVEPQLNAVLALIDNASFDKARTQLAAIETLLKDDASKLADLARAVASAVATVEEAIATRDAIAATETKFEQFLSEADTARAHGSLQEMEDIDDDARQATEHVGKALALFGLQPDDPVAAFAGLPPHFEESLYWSRQFKLKSGRFPLDEWRSGVFELLLIQAEMEVKLARNAPDAEQNAASERALALLERAEPLLGPSKALLGWRAVFLEQLGKVSDAEKILAQAERTASSTALDHYLLGEAQRKRGRYQEALGEYLAAQRIDPDHYWVQHFTGLCYLQLGQPAAALACYSNCVALRPGYSWPWMLRGVCYGQLGRFDDALLEFQQALELDPELFNVFLNRGAVLVSQQKFDDARTDFRRAAELAPESAKPYINLAVADFDEGRFIARSTEADDGLSDLQRVGREQERYDSALESLARASETERAPNHPGIHQLRGRILLGKGTPDAALDAFQRHVALESNSKLKLYSQKQIGFLYFRRGAFPEALAAFEQAAGIEADDPETVFQLAETNLQIGNDAAAVAHFQHFIKLLNLDVRTDILSPEQLYTGIATAFDRLQDKRHALEFYTLALMYNPELPVPLAKRGWSYVSRGPELALADFEQAVQLEDRLQRFNPDTRIGLAYSSAVLRQYDKAIEVLEKVENNRSVATETSKLAQRFAPGAYILHTNTAAVYGRCVDAILQDAALSGEDRQTKGSYAASKALTQLAAALDVASTATDAKGQTTAASRSASLSALRGLLDKLKTDRDLQSLRALEPFRALQEKVAAAVDAEK